MEQNQKIRVLVVDDEPGNVFYLERLLSYQGYEVITADNGIDAIDIMQDKNPDVVLLDIMMPEVTGIDVLDRVSKDPRTRNIPIIMCSAKTDSADVELTLDKGAIEYVRKPIDETELLARLRTVIRIKKHEDTLRSMVKSKEDFIRTVAHDLRTPFASISGFAEILKTDDSLIKAFSDDHIESLNYIINSSNFLVDYFNKLLYWAQQDSDVIRLDLSLFPVKKLIDSSIKLFASKMELKNISIVADKIENIEINADEVYFSQVVNNLLGNALKYTPVGGEIEISAYSSGSVNSISIRDTGKGMDEELIEKILSDKEIQSTPGTEREKGTGLGLQICKRILYAHNFKLIIESEIDKGTKMIIEI